MKLERLLELEVDLPDAPDGCEWRLESVDCSQVVLKRIDSKFGLGFLTNLSNQYGSSVHATVYDQETTLHATDREAALALFAALGLEAK